MYASFDGDKREPLNYTDVTLGSTGLKESGGFIHEEFLHQLQGDRGVRTYREMADNDPIVGALLFAFRQLIRSAEWSVQAVDDSPEAEAGKSFVEEVIDDMSHPWGDLIDEACSMFEYGYAPMEIIWKMRNGPDQEEGHRRSRYSDGKIGIRAISLRAQSSIERWEIDQEDGSVIGVHQHDINKGPAFIPIKKMLLFRTTVVRNNPEGRSVLRNAYRSWYLKKHIENIEAIGVERDLAGLPIARVPSALFRDDASPQEKAALANWKTMVTNIKRDKQEGLVLPSARDQSGNLLFDLELLNTGGSRTLDTTKILERHDRAIATSVLADFIFLGQSAVGSFALSSDKTALFSTAVGGFLSGICDVFNRHMLPRLWTLNDMPPEYMPTLTHGDVESVDIGLLSAYVRDLTGAGATLFPDRELENHLRAAAGLPLAPEDGSDLGEPDFTSPGAPGAGDEDA